MVSVPMASSRLPRPFSLHDISRSRISAGSGVYSIQEVHVARAALSPPSSLLSLFFSCGYVPSKIAMRAQQDRAGREGEGERCKTRMLEASAQRRTERNFEKTGARESNDSIHREYCYEIEPS